jgi:ABC-type glycerol-3-phosphate transport system substrate-binding protein
MRLDWGSDIVKRQYFGLATIIFVLIVCTGLGSVLVNIEWPGGGLAWLRVAAGAILLATAYFLGDLAVRGVRALHGGLPPKNRGSTLDLLDRVGTALKNPRRIIPAIAVAAAWLLVVLLVIPPIISPPTSQPDLPAGDLVMMSAIDESPSDPRQILIRQWNQTHPHNIVHVMNVSGETDEQHRDMVTDAKKDHKADVYLLDVVWMTEFIENGYIQRLDDAALSTDDFLDNVLRTCTDQYGGRDGLWALPFNSDAGLLYYRTDIPRLAKPTTWDEYSGASAGAAFLAAKNNPAIGAAAEKLKAANAAQLDDNEVRTVTGFEAMWAFGGEVVNLDGRLVRSEGAVAFDSSARDGLEKLATAYRDPQITLPDEGMDEGKATTAFKNGEVLFMRNWPVAYDELSTPDGRRAVPFAVTKLPGDSVLGGQNLTVSSSTRNPRAAQAFIEFLTSSASQLILFETGGFAPTRDSAYDNATRSYKDELRGAVASARPRPVIPCYTEFSVGFRKGMRLALNSDGALDDDLPKELARIADKRC